MIESLYVGEQKRKGLYSQHPLKDEWPDHPHLGQCLRDRPETFHGDRLFRDAIIDIFGKAPAEAIMKENIKNCTDRITGQKFDDSFARIADIIKALPDAAELRKLYQSLDVKSSLEDIQVSEEKLSLLIEYSPTVRNRVTLMRLRRYIAE